MGPGVAVAEVRTAVRSCLSDVTAGGLALVACSGGADSLALAAAAAFVAPRLGLRAGGVTVDHGLQEGSDQRAAAVAGRLTELGLDPVRSVAVTVPSSGSGPGPSPGPEAAARTARYAALDVGAQEYGAAVVLLGHTLDDQAETVLLGLARGSGARSLAGMAPAAGRYLRPLLAVPRASTQAACAAQGLVPWQDPHNRDPAYARVRARTLLGELESRLGTGVRAGLARSAELLRADDEALAGWAEQAYADLTRPDGSEGLDCPALAALPPAIRGRVLRRAALDAGARAADLTSAQVGALDALVVGWHGQGPVDLPGGVHGVRDCGRLLFARKRARKLASEATPSRSPEE
jgi:tRNA(Ile)-lysidine synthase